MPIGIGVRRPDGTDIENVGTNLDVAEITYLFSLSKYKSFEFLHGLDPYGDTKFPSNVVTQLREDVAMLLIEVRSRRCPPPPEQYGADESCDPRALVPFGWKGLTTRLLQLQSVLAEAKDGNVIWAMGD